MDMNATKLWSINRYRTVTVGDLVIVYPNHHKRFKDGLCSGVVLRIEDRRSKGVWLTVQSKSGQTLTKKSTCISLVLSGNVILPEERHVFEEIKKDPVALERLKEKARWEACTMYKVLREWGDPRTWPGMVYDATLCRTLREEDI